MSSPQNPLAKYRTYSYHHILIIADSVATAVSALAGQDLTQIINTSTREIESQSSGDG